VENTRFQRGTDRLNEVDGSAGQNVIASLETIAPDLGKYIIEFAFGDIYCREGLSLQEREIITITSLLTTGSCEPQLAVHINGSLNIGISPEKVIETFIQCIPYTGFPKVINAVNVARKVQEKYLQRKKSRRGNSMLKLLINVVIFVLLVMEQGNADEKTPGLLLVKTYTGFHSPTGIAVDREGNLYVSNWSRGNMYPSN
jgi:4-carboxymuconolactone decarboxylase